MSFFNSVQQLLRAATTYPTAVADGAIVTAMADKAGRQIVTIAAPRDLIGTASLNSSSSTSVTFIPAGAAGVFNDISDLVLGNTAAGTAVVTLSDSGAGGNVYAFTIQGHTTLSINFSVPIPQGTSAATWNVFSTPGVAMEYFALFVKNK